LGGGFQGGGIGQKERWKKRRNVAFAKKSDKKGTHCWTRKAKVGAYGKKWKGKLEEKFSAKVRKKKKWLKKREERGAHVESKNPTRYNRKVWQDL